MNRIYTRENHEAYVIATNGEASHIIHFSPTRGSSTPRRDEMIRIVADKGRGMSGGGGGGAYLGSDGYRYQVGETVILKYHPLTHDRSFFDADATLPLYDADVYVGGVRAIIAPRGHIIPHQRPTEVYPEGIIEDYVADIFLTGDGRLRISTQCGYEYAARDVGDEKR